MKTKRTKLIEACERMNEIRVARASVAKLKSEYDALHAYVSHEMGDKLTLEAGEYLAKRTPTTKKPWNKPKLVADGINLDDYKIITPGYSLSVSPK